MPAPRMRVGLVETSAAGLQLAEGMAAAGHHVETLADIATAREYEAIIIAVEGNRLDSAVLALSGNIKPGHIVIHTSLAHGVQVLDELETQGAVVIAAAPVGVQRWAVTSLDELGETIAGLILGEMGVTGIAKTDAERPVLAAHVAHARMLASLSAESLRQVQLLMDEETIPGADVEPTQVIEAYPAITEPGLRRFYAQAARRCAEVDDIEELEMWALQEETR